MPRSAPVDGFTLEYADHVPAERSGEDTASVVLLHGWPGDSNDFREVVPRLAGRARVVVPDLRGFGHSDRHLVDADRYYSRDGQARSVAGLIRELGLHRPVVAAYDLGSGVAQALMRSEADLLGAVALSPPLPGAGDQVFTPEIAPEMWYHYLHRSPLAEAMDGNRDLIRTHLRYIWQHWSGPDFDVDGPEFELLVDLYARPGAFLSSVQYYRAGGGYFARIVGEVPPSPGERPTVPLRVLWPEFDPLFPRDFAARVDEFYADVEVAAVDGVGHFTPLEAPDEFVGVIDQALAAAVR